MLVEEKFRLSRRKNLVSFIEENLFIRVYNHSAFIVTTQFNVPLKLTYQYVKKCNNQLLISGGFPKSVIANYFPNVLKTDWGYELSGSWDMRGYTNWQSGVVAEAATQQSAQVLPALAGDTSARTENFTYLRLTKAQSNYLHNWQKDNYPIEVDLGFIESLKRQLAKTGSNSN